VKGAIVSLRTRYNKVGLTETGSERENFRDVTWATMKKGGIASDASHQWTEWFSGQ
jgi:hypothetical protein